jgi:hypothetical protein
MEKLFKIKNHNSFIIVDTDQQEMGKVQARHLFLKSEGLLSIEELEIPTKEQVETFFNWTETVFGYSTLTSEKRYQKDLKLVKQLKNK